MTPRLRAAAVLALLAAAPARADDRALVADFDRSLVVNADDYDERAILAAVLTKPGEQAAFDADARAALNNPALRALMLTKWRGALAAFADAGRALPDIDLSRRYANWSEMMSPSMRAYTAQRMLSMTPENRDKLIYYLKKLNADLAADGGKIDTGFFSIDKRIVQGVMDAYKKDLAAYAATPLAAQGRSGGAAAAAQLARDLAAASETAPTPPPAEKKPVALPAPKAKLAPPVKAPVRLPPAAAGGPAAAPAPAAGGALDQLRGAAAAGEAGGAVIDGATASKSVPTPAPAGGVAGAAAGGLTLAAPAPGATAVAAEPPPPGAADEAFMNGVEGLGRARPPSSTTPALLAAGAGLGLGALIGFLVGGPIGAAIGAAAGGLIGLLGAKGLFHELFS